MEDIEIQDVLSEDNIIEAIRYLQNKRDSYSSDGIRMSEIQDYWELNADELKEAIYEKHFESDPVQLIPIVKKNGKKRVVSKLSAKDRLITRAMMQVLESAEEPCFSDHCFAYRKDKSARDAVSLAADYLQQGYSWVCEIDIENYFDNISHDLLMKEISSIISDERMIYLAQCYVKCRTEEDGEVEYKTKGIVQGSSLSPLLSNIFLNSLDWYMEEKGYHFYRYGDDINLYCSTKQAAENVYADICKQLSLRELCINKEKSGIHKGITRRCLGYEFFTDSGQIIAKRINRRREIYNRWQKASIQKIDHVYHLVNDGVITRRDYTVLFENEENKYYLPVEAMDCLSIYSSVTFSGQFFEFANENKIIVPIIDKSGERIGTFIPATQRRNYKIEMEQLAIRQNTALQLKLAKTYQNANIFNLRANLRYYLRRDRDELKESVEYLTDLLKKINEAKDVSTLMMYEAQARQKYYQCFNIVMADELFQFHTRTKRPPKDAINAMISFGNTILYQRFANYIYQSSLDIRFGIVHNSYTRSESLNLDLADLFKPVLVDRTIFTLVNRKMLDVDIDFRPENGGVYLTERGKRIFIKEFERKLFQKVQINAKTKNYDMLMKEEVQKLEKYYRNKEKYKPYKYVN